MRLQLGPGIRKFDCFNRCRKRPKYQARLVSLSRTVNYFVVGYLKRFGVLGAGIGSLGMVGVVGLMATLAAMFSLFPERASARAPKPRTVGAASASPGERRYTSRN